MWSLSSAAYVVAVARLVPLSEYVWKLVLLVQMFIDRSRTGVLSRVWCMLYIGTSLSCQWSVRVVVLVSGGSGASVAGEWCDGAQWGRPRREGHVLSWYSCWKHNYSWLTKKSKFSQRPGFSSSSCGSRLKHGGGVITDRWGGPHGSGRHPERRLCPRRYARLQWHGAS